MKVNTVSVRLPYPSVSLKKFARKTKTFLLEVAGSVKDAGGAGLKTSVEAGSRIKRPKISGGKTKKVLLYGVVILVVLFVGVRIIGSGGGDDRVEVDGAKATQEIGREYVFPLLNNEGENVSDLKYFIDSAELRDEIVVQGQRATSIKGRTFLIVKIKVSNEHDQAININTRDYMRLSVSGNNEEWLAPDIHNDPVEVQAISTKLTRLGFPINETDTELVLRVGEIDGEKEEIPLDLN